MSSLSTPAIILRRIEYGDFDLILSFLTLEKGKLSAIAKSARKSTKRFGGILELFAALDILCSTGKRSGLPVLQEAALKQPFAAIRASIISTAYASYWAELIDGWSEEGQRQPDLYELLLHVLTELDLGRTPADVLSILFQIRFLMLSGHGPILRGCSRCKRDIDRIEDGTAEVVAAAAAQLPGTMESTQRLVVELQSAAVEMRGAATDVRALGADAGPELRTAIRRLGEAAESAATMTARLDKLVADNEDSVSRFADEGLTEIQVLVRDLREASQAIEQLGRQLEADPSQLLYQPATRGVEIPP